MTVRRRLRKPPGPPGVAAGMAELTVHRAEERFLTRGPGIETRHSFSYGTHWDAANTSFGPLVLHDEHRLEPGAGFSSHRHQGVEVVSWVLEGLLVHEDPAGGVRALGPGSLQHLSTGHGTVHAERAGAVATRFVQAWLTSPGPPAAPSYAVRVPEPTGLRPVLEVGSAVLHAGRLDGAGTVRLGRPGALLHLFVAGGRIEAAGQVLAPGDALRCTGRALELRAEEHSELLAWEMQVTSAQE